MHMDKCVHTYTKVHVKKNTILPKESMMGRTTIQSGKSLGDHLIQLLWLMGKLRPIEKVWLMVTQDIKTDF